MLLLYLLLSDQIISVSLIIFTKTLSKIYKKILFYRNMSLQFILDYKQTFIKKIKALSFQLLRSDKIVSVSLTIFIKTSN